MARKFRASFAWLPIACLLAAWPLAWFTSTANAESRKFVVFLADPPKDHPGAPLVLPNRNDVYDSYFDKTKDGQPGQTLVESYAEWWEEVSYGDITVSGDVFGWISLPWPTSPPGFGGDTSFGGTGVIEHIDLTGDFTYTAGEGESFNPFVSKYQYDYDGPGFGADPVDGPGGFQFDQYFTPIWTPGERFRDLNNNRIYDAGTPEWGIDKNGNGQIDIERRTTSAAVLLAGDLWDTTDPENPIFLGWDVSGDYAEWWDFNGNFQFDFSFGGEIWIDRDLDGNLDTVMPDVNGAPPTLLDFLQELRFGDNNNVEWFDSNRNGRFDFPEPFEDYMRLWSQVQHQFVPITGDYIRANFPGLNPENLTGYDVQNNPGGRTGNGIYDSPDAWSNAFNNRNSANKIQLPGGFLNANDELAEQQRRSGPVTPRPDWLDDFWDEYYGGAPPDWSPAIEYTHIWNPGEPRPLLIGEPETARNPLFQANRGGPTGNGRPFRDNTWGPQGGDNGTILPDPGDARDGMYDGPREFADLPSSIYYSGGDGYIGEVTGVENNSRIGQDIGAGDPVGVTPDGIIPAGGPLAFNVHGDGGYDAGNVQNLELLTWRTDGTSLTDDGIDIDGDGVIDFIFQYHRDINLDGMVDMGETPGKPGEFGFPAKTEYSNYGVDANPGTAPNGGPGSEYPYNRHRLLESIVAALDDAVDWDEFLNGPGRFGNVISGVILLPEGTARGMFSLPAPSFDQMILTRDGNPDARRRSEFVPVPFFDGLGISLNDDQGEGGAFDVGSFHTPFSAHEYGHSWEGFPDLYDYDVYRSGFSGRIINNPIGAWCVMAGGGLVHPVPILKEDSGWIEPVDITRVLVPAGNTTLNIKAWEFDRFRTVYTYTNPLYESEIFYLWRNSPGILTSEGQLALRGDRAPLIAFDAFQPGHGILIMHVDRRGNLEGLPLQQRLESHFTYTIVQADGLQNLESGENMGDDGDPFPGSTGRTTWNRGTDPANTFYNGQPSGLEIVNITESYTRNGPNGQELPGPWSQVVFRWFPRELPTFEWVQPPGGVSVSGRYPLRFIAFDQFGGTRIEFYAVRTVQDQDPLYTQGILLGPPATKPPGEIDGIYQAPIRQLGLEDGTYVFYAKMIPGRGADNSQENFWSVPRASIDNQGTGALAVQAVDPAISRFERWTVRCINDTPPGAETWSVEGSLSGMQVATATTGVVYSSDVDQFGRSALRFLITSGATPFDDPDDGDSGDQFLFLTTGLTDFSDAVLVKDGEVVTPQPPIAIARTENNLISGLSPLNVTFRHDLSNDPLGAALTFRWDFGDGTLPFTTTQLDRPVPHRYEHAGTFQAVLTVTNSFGLSAQATVTISVREALPPTVRASAAPTSGAGPLRVQFSGELSTDPNPGTQGLDFVWNFGDDSAPALTARADHVYATPGVYRSTLTVTNRPYGKSASRTIEIRVAGPPADQPPTAGFTASRLSGKAPLAVQFDGSSSSDPEADPLEFSWNFGDRSAIVSGVSDPQHTFDRAGTYNVTLTVADSSDQTDTATLTIVVTSDSSSNNQSPVARIRTSSTQGPAPFTVTFDARTSADPDGGALSYRWDFGDGSDQVEGDVVTHTYTTPREYSVVLGVADSSGGEGAATIKVTVTSPVDDSGRPTTGGDNPVPEIPGGCGGGAAGCGPAGLTPMALTLLGIAGMRRRKGARRF